MVGHTGRTENTALKTLGVRLYMHQHNWAIFQRGEMHEIEGKI